MKKLLKQLMRFGFVGVSAFLIDYSLLVILTELLDVNYLISATISFTVSVVYNYTLSTRFVFGHREGMNRAKECIVFFVLAAIGLAINDGVMYLGTSIFGITYLLSKIGAALVVSVWNFTTRKLFLESHV